MPARSGLSDLWTDSSFGRIGILMSEDKHAARIRAFITVRGSHLIAGGSWPAGDVPAFTLLYTRHIAR